MNQFNFDFSLKNIPYGGKLQYQKCLVRKVEKFITNMRWKLYHILNPGRHQKNTYGFNTTHSPPQLRELNAFEEDLFKMIRDIKFRQVRNSFQQKLLESVKSIRNSKNVIVKADKTRNLYEIAPDDYRKLLRNNITAEYKKSDIEKIQVLNKEASKITNKLDIADRIDKYTESNAFITIKDHKAEFPGRIQCRLINPAKSNLGKISKAILGKHVKEIKQKTNSNQWKNSSDAIEWFKKLENKNSLVFFKFDINSYYPSITENLFNEALEWSKGYTTIPEEEIQILRHTRKSFLFYQDEPWVKKTCENFDVTMGAYDGAEMCEFIGLYILNKLKSFIDQKQVGLYRDDGLAAVSGSGPDVERLRKKIIRVFKDLGLNVSIEANMKQTDFLDIFFDLEKNLYKLYRKPNENPIYINEEQPSQINYQI